MEFENNIEIFSSRDKIREQIIDLSKEMLALENFDYNKSSYLSYLINTLSVLQANQLFYNSSVWKNLFLVTADQKESVVNWANMVGYTPEFAYPAQVKLLITIPLDFITDSNYVSFSMYGSTDNAGRTPHSFKAKEVVFNLLNTLDINITKSSSTVYSAYIQENYVNQDIVSETSYSFLPYEIVDIENSKKGLRFITRAIQVFSLSQDDTSFPIPALKTYEFFSKDIDFKGQVSDVEVITYNQRLNKLLESGNVNLSTSTTTWQRYSSIPLIPDGISGYVLKNTSRGVRLYFGNGIYGVQPREGDECSIRLYLTNGEKGNVIPGSITTSDSIIVQDGTKTKQVKPTVINPEPAYNGKDTPSIDDIRRGTISHIKTGSRLVSKDDFNSFSDVAQDLPVATTVHVLKRSDLKRNEICLFTDLIYNDTVNNESYIVPTRNVLWEMDTTQDSLVIRTGDEITVDDVEYVSLFNVEVDPVYLESRYFYAADNLEVPITVSRSQKNSPDFLPTKVLFYIDSDVDPTLDKSYFELYYSKLTTASLSGLICEVEIPWNGKTYSLPHSVSSSKFYLNFADYLGTQDIPKGAQSFKFTIYDGAELVCVCFAEATIVVDLTEFMYSQIRLDGGTGNYLIYDVPVVLKEYYDRVNKEKFNFYVMSKFVQFDVTKYRMLTDFINLKLSNTTGKMKNMLLNDVDRAAVVSLNPTELPVTTFGSRYAVSAEDNPWNREPGFIAERIDNISTEWGFESLTINDMFYVTGLGQFMVYNGEDFIEPITNIPLDIEIVVWMDPKYSGTDNSLVEKIKNKLINELFVNFGYDQDVLISEITRIVKSISGVHNCKVIKPEHDIQFTFKYEQLSEDQLLTYTPCLMYFDSNSIQIDLKI